MSIERLRDALRLFDENRTTVQSLASSVGDFLREVDNLHPAARADDRAVFAALTAFNAALSRESGFQSTPKAMRAALEAYQLAQVVA